MHSKQGLGAVLAVVVVYQRPWRSVHASRLLEAALTGGRDPDGGAVPALGRLLVYDNSPVPAAQSGASSVNCDYVHDASNGGTRAAYLRALQVARESGLSWLILLDQDTTLTASYLDELERKLKQSPDPSLGLLFPRVVARDGPVSPATINRWGTVVPVDGGHPSVPELRGSLTAVASGAAVRVEALAAVGEIPQTLWLDYLDHWLFRQLQRMGYRAECLSATLEHDLSVRSESLPGADRQRNILCAERYFTGTLGLVARMAYPFRLLRRAAKVLPRDAGAAWVIFRQAVQGWPGR